MQFQQDRKILYSLAFLLMPFLVSIPLSYTEFILSMDRRLADFKYIFFNSNDSISKEIVLIEIDDLSLQTLKSNPFFGRWPWKRNVYEPLLFFLAEGEPKAILFDILFSEPTSEDIALVRMNNTISSISHAFHSETNTNFDKNLKSLERFDLTIKTNLAELPLQVPVLLPADSILDSSKLIHSVSYLADNDGKARQYQIAVRLGQNTLPSLALQGYLLSSNRSLCSYSKVSIACPGFPPISHLNGSHPIHYPTLRSLENIERVSISKVYNSYFLLNKGQSENLPVHSEFFKDKIIIIGATAIATYDNRITPYGIIPGPYIQASILSNYLLGVERTDFGRGVELTIYFIFSLVIIFLFVQKVEFYKKIILFNLLMIGIILSNFLIFYLFSIHLTLLIGILYLPISLAIFVAIVIGQDRREKKKLTVAMTKYVAAEIVEDVLANRKVGAEVGSKREITILFSDIRGFTELSETTPAEIVVGRLNSYFASMVKCVTKNQGTLDKFIGDAIMAFWNAPTMLSNHQEFAVLASLDMSIALQILNQHWIEHSYRPWKMGVGIHSGLAIVGNIGSEERINYTAIGDSVNLSSRIESLTKVFGVEIIFSESVLEFANIRLKDHIRILGKTKVKGRLEEVNIFELKSFLNDKEKNDFIILRDGFHEALRFLNTEDKKKSTQIFSKLNKEFPEDGPVKYYLSQIKSHSE